MGASSGFGVWPEILRWQLEVFSSSSFLKENIRALSECPHTFECNNPKFFYGLTKKKSFISVKFHMKNIFLFKFITKACAL